ncbi:MAG: hypothetical protein IH886_05370 [Nitrospinae bacterium]|nr:hypothetical protein [Nitrospinota bacterium]
MTEKRKLPNRRAGYTQKMKIGGQTVYLHTGEFGDGTLGEIFIDLSKEGALIRSMMNCFCIAISVALQYGASLEDLADKFLHSKFEPAGIVQNHADIKMCSSILDAIFRDLAIHYLDRNDLKHGPKEVGK